jgi:tetratricopeptide (TPR) repeat protein
MRRKNIIIVITIVISSIHGSCEAKGNNDLKNLTESEVLYDIGSAIKAPPVKNSNKTIQIGKDPKPLNPNDVARDLNRPVKDNGIKYNNIFGSVEYNQDIKQQNNQIHKSKTIDISVEDRSQEYEKTMVISMIEEASMAFKLGHLEASTTLYENILDIDHSNQDATLGLAVILHKTGVLPEAKKLYTKILSHDPLNQTALNNFLSLIGEESPDVALFELKKLESINPTMSVIPAQISVIYSNQQDYKMALGYLKKAYMLSPNAISYKYNLAILLDKLGDKANAIKLYRELIIDNENNVSLPGSVEVIRRRLIFLSSKNY